jgi:hypothetical protein
MPSKKPVITIRVESDEYELLKQQADHEFRSVPSLVLAIVKKTLQEWKSLNQDKEENDRTY